VAGDVQEAGFAFRGFLPAKGRARQAGLQALLAADGAQVLFEAPHRIRGLALELAAAAPSRRLTLCRELTKQFETVVTMTAAELPGWLGADANRLRGEFVLVLHAQARPDRGDPHADAGRILGVLRRELPLKQAVALAAEISGAPRKALYARALQWQQGANLESDDDQP
jgi:16S rRNA (cytidine1402-2'-O)-methyltransferase